MRRQDKIDMHDPKDAGVHAKKAKQASPKPTPATDKAAAGKKDASPAHGKTPGDKG